MYLLMLRTNSVLIFALMFTGCSVYKGTFEIPDAWHTQLLEEMTIEDPTCFPWWEAFNDSVLNDLISHVCQNPDVQLAMCSGGVLEAANKVAAEIAKSYIELRGLQWRLEGIEKQIAAQETTVQLGSGLSTTGIIGDIHQNENTMSLFSLLARKTEIQLALDRTFFHLSTLTTEPLDCLYERLSCSQGDLSLPCDLPVGTPCDIIHGHPGIRDARKAYLKSQNRLAFFNYQKKSLAVFEEVESSLSALRADQAAVSFLENVKNLKSENYQLIKDLNQQGLKSDTELQIAYQELLSAEDAYHINKTKLLIDYVNLYQAQGGGFECG